MPVIEDWHAKQALVEVRLFTGSVTLHVYFMQIIWKYFVSQKSASQHGTLYQIRNLIGHTKVVTKTRMHVKIFLF